ncbi:type II secretion system protein N (GspN) [Azomonas agilis]|uniref:Type II secretion system protein N (GspN) n=1 Tax=Azomonas agilis TaxID=116849 RepID=A0A562IKA2_9GAMM|nr:type II secretion system protein N [Azomonas agilis]TWH71451.1 type II secretion system protein N (GspN) [Azomonas agilis]
MKIAGLCCIALLVFLGHLIPNSPAHFWLECFTWPKDWQPVGVTGRLVQGRIEQLGWLGPVTWDTNLWPPRLSMEAGLQQQNWQVQLEGWPWQWQARVWPTHKQPTPQTAVHLEGDWHGQVQIQGQGLVCQSASGQIQGQWLQLVSPWSMPLGQAQISLLCAKEPQLKLSVQQPESHQLNMEAYPYAQRSHWQGQLASGSEWVPILRQLGWLGADEHRFERNLSW